MADVSWFPKYTIEIADMDGDTVHNLAKALRDNLSDSLGEDTYHCFEQIIGVCETISKLDDED